MLDFQKLCRWYMAYCGVVRILELALLGSMVAEALFGQMKGKINWYTRGRVSVNS